jgi:hypothetical protein
MADLVCLNLSGKKFFVLLKNFAKLPNTRLAKMVSSDATHNLIYSLPHKNVLTRNAEPDHQICGGKYHVFVRAFSKED